MNEFCCVCVCFFSRGESHKDVYARSADHHVHSFRRWELHGCSNGTSFRKTQAGMGVSFTVSTSGALTGRKWYFTTLVIKVFYLERPITVGCSSLKLTSRFVHIFSLCLKRKHEDMTCRTALGWHKISSARCLCFSCQSDCGPTNKIIELDLQVWLSCFLDSHSGTVTMAETAEQMSISFQPERSFTSLPLLWSSSTTRNGLRDITWGIPTVSSGKKPQVPWFSCNGLGVVTIHNLDIMSLCLFTVLPSTPIRSELLLGRLQEWTKTGGLETQCNSQCIYQHTSNEVTGDFLLSAREPGSESRNLQYSLMYMCKRACVHVQTKGFDCLLTLGRRLLQGASDWN